MEGKMIEKDVEMKLDEVDEGYYKFTRLKE